MVFEAKIIEFLQTNATVGWINLFKNFTGLASIGGLIFFAVIIFMKNKRLSVWFCLSFGLVAIVNSVIKKLVKRPRPFEVYTSIMNLGAESGFSMPSGHAAVATVIALFVCYYAFTCSKNKLLRALTIIVMTLFVAMICLSRMILGVHYLTDTLAGIGVGALVGSLMIFLYHRYIKNITITVKRSD